MELANLKQAINQLSAQQCIGVLHECAEHLGLVSVESASEILCVKRRTLYQQVKDKKVLSVEIGDKIFVCIND